MYRALTTFSKTRGSSIAETACHSVLTGKFC